MTEFKVNSKNNNRRFNKKEHRSRIIKINKRIKQSCDKKDLPFEDNKIEHPKCLNIIPNAKSTYKNFSKTLAFSRNLTILVN